MCGISVVVDPGGSPATRDTLRRLHEPIPHRGPDGEGFLLVDAGGRAERADALVPGGPAVLGLGFRRLKVRDLSDAAAQPLATTNGSCFIVFNGEIDNFRELRGELEGRGFRFRSTGDAEVALAAFEAWGEECFRRFEGMWAIAIADLGRRRLVVSRDRFGIKPLYWARDGARLLLASEAKQILNARDERPRAHAPVLARWLRGQRLPGLDDTFFAGIRAVPPATWFEVPFDAEGAPVFRSYWDLAAFSCPDPARALPYAAAKARLRETLTEVVASQDVADVTVGCLLSGGLDSATLAALLARARPPERKPLTFSFGLRDDPSGELPLVDALVAREGWPNHQAGLDAAWLATHAPRAVRALEEPPLSLAALAQYRVFQLCREHGATVVLDGHGADEVMAGYPYHQRTLLFDRARRLRLGDLARETRAIAAAHGAPAWAVLREMVRPGLARRARAAPSWIDPAYGGSDEDERRAARADRGHDPSRVNRQLYGDVKWGNAKIVLAFSDKNAMAHSIEARVPYLDRRVVELLFTLPDHHKVGAGQRKRILRDVARDGLLPREITDRADRLGFSVPDADLLSASAAALDPFVERVLGATCLVRAQAGRAWSDFRQGRLADRSQAWRLAALGLWAASFDVAIG